MSEQGNVTRVFVEGAPAGTGLGEPPPAGSRVIHTFGPKLSVAALDETSRGAIALEALPREVDAEALQLNENERIALHALQLGQSAAYREAKRARPRDGEPWDSGDQPTPSVQDLGDDQFAGVPGAAGGSTSARLVGKVAISVVLVEGPTDATKVTTADLNKIVMETVDGMSWYAGQEPDAHLSFDWTIKKVSLDVHPGAGGQWGNLPVAFQKDVDATVYRKNNNRIYFFKGDQYVRIGGDSKVEPGYPKPIAGNWKGLPASFEAGIDAALWRDSNGKLYFFKGSQYVRIGTDSKVEPGYPKPIAGNWKGLPASFNSGIDAAVWRESNQKIYFFKGGQYVRIGSDSSTDAGYPKPIKGNWGVPADWESGIDAAMLRFSNGKMYFFKGSDYLRWKDPQQMDPGYPKQIAVANGDREKLWRDPAMAKLGYSADWNGVTAYAEDLRKDKGAQWSLIAFFTRYPLKWFGYAGRPRIVMHLDNGNWGQDNIDRVFTHETGHIFGAPDEYASSDCGCGGAYGFFRQPNKNCANCAPGGGVSCIMKSNSWSVCSWTPGHLGWKEFLTNIDAALYRVSNDRIYLFSGPWYVRLTDDTQSGPESGYPKPIAGNWKGLPASFEAGIDAALMRKSNGKIYFFKGSQYVRIGTDSKVEPGYPKPIAGNWKGLPASFNSGIDAAVWRESNQKIYFFKGGQYVRIGSDSSMDAGYPKPIKGNWGVPADWESGIDAAMLRFSNGKMYFFKGRRYLRWKDPQTMDPNYPRWIHGNWMAFPK